MVGALRYKLRKIGARLEGLSDVYYDNDSVVTNPSVPLSVLNKRYNAIFYNRVREAQTVGTFRVGWISVEDNLVDFLTNTTMRGNMRHGMVESIFYNKAVVIREKDEI